MVHETPYRRMLVSYGAKTALPLGCTSFVRPLSSLVEHFLGKEEVVGPIPTGGSRLQTKSGRRPGGVAQVVRAHGS